MRNRSLGSRVKLEFLDADPNDFACGYTVTGLLRLEESISLFVGAGDRRLSYTIAMIEILRFCCLHEHSLIKGDRDSCF